MRIQALYRPFFFVSFALKEVEDEIEVVVDCKAGLGFCKATAASACSIATAFSWALRLRPISGCSRGPCPPLPSSPSSSSSSTDEVDTSTNLILRRLAEEAISRLSFDRKGRFLSFEGCIQMIKGNGGQILLPCWTLNG